MSIVSTDIKYRLSGGAANTDPNASLGGIMSTSTEWGAALHDLFDAVSAAESSPGDVEYRGFYVLNNHGSLTLVDARVFFTTTADDIDMGLASAAAGSSMASIANESTNPESGGITFTHPTTYAAGLQLNGSGGLTLGQQKGVWLRRTIPAAAPAETNHTETLRVQGETS